MEYETVESAEKAVSAKLSVLIFVIYKYLNDVKAGLDIPLKVLGFQVNTLNDERDWRYGMRVKLLKKQVIKLISFCGTLVYTVAYATLFLCSGQTRTKKTRLEGSRV